MRTDMASMNPGKAVAQGAHAANIFGEIMHTPPFDNSPFFDEFREWQGIRMFGTTITLGVNLDQLYEKNRKASDAGFICGICHDPTYPLRDGDYTHLIPVDTCGYIFGSKERLADILGDLELMK